MILTPLRKCLTSIRQPCISASAGLAPNWANGSRPERGLSTRVRSILALAVSVAVIGMGAWLLGGMGDTSSAPDSLPSIQGGPGTADIKDMPGKGGNGPQLNTIGWDPITGRSTL